MNIYPSYVEDVLGEWLRYKVWSDFDRLNDGLWHNPFIIEQPDFPKAREYLVDWNYTTDTEIKFPYPVLHSTSNYLKSISHYNSKNKLKYNVAVGNIFEITSDTNAPPQPFHVFSNKRSKFIYDRYGQLAIQSEFKLIQFKLIHKFYSLLNIIRPINPTDTLHGISFSSDLNYFGYFFPSLLINPSLWSDIKMIYTNKASINFKHNINALSYGTYTNSFNATIKHTITSNYRICPSSNVWYPMSSWQEFRNGWSTTCS
jgi:hypothetical protein